MYFYLPQTKQLPLEEIAGVFGDDDEEIDSSVIESFEMSNQLVEGIRIPHKLFKWDFQNGRAVLRLVPAS